jgi:hypothetical protein
MKLDVGQLVTTTYKHKPRIRYFIVIDPLVPPDINAGRPHYMTRVYSVSSSIFCYIPVQYVVPVLSSASSTAL